MIEFLFAQYKDYPNYLIALELIAVVFGIISVLFARKNNILVYPTGLVSTILYVYILFEFQLYGDLIINFYYTIMSFLGWYLWSKTNDGEDEFPISIINRKEILVSTLIFTITLTFVALVYHFFDKFTDWTAYVDALTTGLFFVGMWLMAKRKIENWIAWIFSNIIAIPLNFYKGFMLFTLMYILFLVMAYLGLKEWKKKLG